MDGRRFDDLARSLARGTTTRRRLLAGTAAAVAGALGGVLGRLGGSDVAAACNGVNQPCGSPPNCCNGLVCRNGRCRCAPCGPDQVAGAGCICRCNATGHPPGPGGCPCPNGQRRCTPPGPCVECCDASHCPGTPCINNVCGCPAGQKLCRGVCIPNASCCVDADCEDGDPCTTNVCQPNRTCLSTPVANGGQGACPGGQVCCSGGCATVAGFCPPEQTFDDCVCTCPGATLCGNDCCITATETCLGGTTCCANASVCEGGTVCCAAGQDCCSDVCRDTATFCPPEQTYSDCACTCPGATFCGEECCVTGQEACIDAAQDFCCPTQRACQGDTLCCDAGEACCANACETIATFCPPAQTFDDCACICDAGESVCGALCCVSATETCLNDASCCANADACVVDSAPDECCTGDQVCGGGTEGCCLPADAGTCATDGDCCAPNWCEASTDLCRVPRTNGAACDRDPQCDSAFCCPTENVCGVAGGDTCAVDGDCCGDFWCHDTTDDCDAPLAVGVACTRAAQCEVGNCCATDDVCGVASGVSCDPTADECCPGLACRGDDGRETCQPNLPPVANSQTGANAVQTGDVDPVTITLTGSDPDGDPLTFAIVTPPTTGTLGSITQLTPTSASVVYTPVQGSFGSGSETYSFTFKVNDGAVDSPPATVEIEVFDEPEDASYVTVGNTELVTDGFNTAVTTPKVTNPDGVLATTPTLTIANAGTPITTTAGGSVVLDADGHFRYTPPVTTALFDSFEYEVNWGGAATVDIDFTGKVWYVRNNAAAGGDGRSHLPFDTLVEAQTASATGEFVFVHRGDGTTTGQNAGITLKNDQELIGEGVALVVGSFTLLPAGLPPQIGNAAGAAITLASDNTVRGLDVVGAGGAGIVGTGLGAATFNADTVNVTRTGGPALNLETGNVNAAFGTLSSTDSTTRGLRLVGLTGTLSATGGAISGAAQGAVLVSGGNANITYPGTITNAAGPSVEVNSRTGGSVNLSGTISDTGQGVRASSNTGGTLSLSGSTKTLNTGANAAIQLTTNTGATVTFSGGGLDVDTTSGVGLLASGGGTLVISGSNNSVTTTAGQAIDLDAIATNVALASVASTGSGVGVAGIDLTNLGANSAFASTTTGVTNPGGTGINVATVGTGATLGFGATTVTNRSGKGVALNAVAGAVTFGATTITNPSNNDLAAFEVVNSAASVTVTSATISNVAGANGRGLNLDNNTGVVDIQAGAISAVTAGVGVRVNAGNANATYAGTVTNTGGRTVAVTGRTGGTVTLSGDLTGGGTGILVQDNNASGTPAIVFSGATKAISTGANAAVTLDNNDVATINFSGGGLAITTTTGIGFNAINGATAINVTTGTNPNTIASVGGVALSVVSSNIGASGLTFRSISASGGANGIVLDSTGSSGGLTVNGDGTNANNGTGGTIQSTTSDGIVLTSTRSVSLNSMIVGDPTATTAQAADATVNIGGDGISMSTVDDTTLRGLKIARTGVHGIDGTGVTNLTISGSEILNAGDGNEENGLNFAAVGANNLDGTVSITNTTIVAFAEDGVFVENFSGTLSLTLSGVTIGRNANTLCSGVTCGENGIQVRADGTSSITLAVTNSFFDDVDGNGIFVVAEGSGGVADVSIDTTRVENATALGIVLFGGDLVGNASQLSFDITSNSAGDDGVFNTRSNAISIQPNGSSTVRGTLSGTKIQGSQLGYGVDVPTDDDAKAVLVLDTNTISGTECNGIRVLNGNTAELDVHIRGNAVSTPADTQNNGICHGIEVNARETSDSCLDISGNTSDGGNIAVGYRTRQRDTSVFRLERFTGNGTLVTDVVDFLVDQNTSGDASATVATTYTGVADGFCEEP